MSNKSKIEDDKNNLKNMLKFVAKNSSNSTTELNNYYENAFSEINEGKKCIWNWAAFSGGFVWLFYRKMYVFGLVTIIVSTLSVTLFKYSIIMLFSFFVKVSWFAVNMQKILYYINIIDVLFQFIINLILGLYGNLFYYNHLKKLLNQAPLNYKRSKNVDPFILCLGLINVFLSEIANGLIKKPDYLIVGYLFAILIWLPLLTNILIRLRMDAKEKQKQFLLNRLN